MQKIMHTYTVFMLHVKEKFKNLRVGDLLLKINYMYKKSEKSKVTGKNFPPPPKKKKRQNENCLHLIT